MAVLYLFTFILFKAYFSWGFENEAIIPTGQDRSLPISNSNIFAELKELKKKYDDLKLRLDRTEEDKRQQQTVLDHLSTELRIMQNEKTEFREKQEKSFQELRNRYDDLKQTCKDLKHDQGEMKVELHEFRNKCRTDADKKRLNSHEWERNREEESQIRRRTNTGMGSQLLGKDLKAQSSNKRLLAADNMVNAGSPVGFSVRLANSLADVMDGQIIKFDSVTTNNGNGYSPNTGVFTCSYPGLYVFYSNILAEKGKHIETEMVRNGVNVALVMSAGASYLGDGSNMAVIELDAGDTVWMKIHSKYHMTGVEVHGNHFSSFSGFLIR